jgi:hypothetical protein
MNYYVDDFIIDYNSLLGDYSLTKSREGAVRSRTAEQLNKAGVRGIPNGIY